MRWRVIVVKKPVSAWSETRSFSSHGITQSFQNFNVISFVDRLTSWCKFVVHNTLTIEKNNQHWLDMAPTLTCYLNACTTPLSVLCPYFRPQRPSVSFQLSPYNSCRDRRKTWCKFVDLFFLSFSTVNKCDERKKHVGQKHTLHLEKGVQSVTTAFSVHNIELSRSKRKYLFQLLKHYVVWYCFFHALATLLKDR